MTMPDPTLYVGHDDEADVDWLVTVWEDGTAEIACRQGSNQYGTTWSAPVRLQEVGE
jgi:hypothetical protein